MLRFVVLINCYTLRADRAGGLRRVAEFVANVLPELGRRRDHPGAINFFFTHVEALNIQGELKPETACGQVHHWLREVLDGSEETGSLAVLRWMRNSMDLYTNGKLNSRFVDIYHPEWTASKDAQKAVARFTRQYALCQEGPIQAMSVGAILMPSSKVKVENMLMASRDEVRRMLEEARPEDLPMLRTLWKNIELVKEYLTSLPIARKIRDDISNMFARRFEDLSQEASALLSQLESDKEDFSELEANKLWNMIIFLEGIASLGHGSCEVPTSEEHRFQKKLESSLNQCLERSKTACHSTDLAKLPQASDIIRWQSKISAWHALKLDWAKQMSVLIEDHIEQASREAKKAYEIGNRVIMVARQENVKDIAAAVDAFCDATKMEEIFQEAFDALQKQFQQVFENASERALSSVKAVLESPASTPKFDFAMLGEVATSIEESRSAWDGAEGVAPQTRACLATWHQHLRGAVTGWLSDLLDRSREVLQNVAQLAAGNEHQVVDQASGICYKNICDTMRSLTQSLPEPHQKLCHTEFCEVAHMEVQRCTKQLTSAAMTLAAQIASGFATPAVLQNLLAIVEVLPSFSWSDRVDTGAGECAITDVIGTVQQRVKKYVDDLGSRFENQFFAFLEDSPNRRSPSLMMQAWEEFQRLRCLAPIWQLVGEHQLEGKIETLLEKWICGFSALMAKSELESAETFPNDLTGFGAITAPEPQLCGLDLFPAESINSILGAHDHLQPLLKDAGLPSGWKEALDRLQKGVDRLKALFVACRDAGSNYKEKDLILCALHTWRGHGLHSFLQRLGQESLEDQVKRQVLKELDDVHQMILDPMQRQSAATKLANLRLSDLHNSAFDEAKRSLQEYQCLLNARNVEDDKAIQFSLESFNFKGLKELLGEIPEMASTETAATKVFHQRLDRIKQVVLDRLNLAKQSLLMPDKFTAEFRKLKEAESNIGDYLKLYQEVDLTEEVRKMSEKATQLADARLMEIKAALERKNYDACLDCADQLQVLAHPWHNLGIVTTTKLSEMDLEISKARGCLAIVTPLLTSFLKNVRHLDENTNSRDLNHELRQLQMGCRNDVKDAYQKSVEHMNLELNKIVEEVVQIAAQNSSSFGIDALVLAKKHIDEGLHDHLISTVPSQVEKALEKLKREVEARNEDILGKLFSAEKFQQLKARLDKLKALSDPLRHGTWSVQGVFYKAATSQTDKREAQFALKDYQMLKEKVNRIITESLEEGMSGLGGGNFEVAGSVLRFKGLIDGHLREHLDSSARSSLDRFAAKVNTVFSDRLDNFVKAQKDGHEVGRAMANLGQLLDFLHHVSLQTTTSHRRTQFHDALSDFVDGQRKRMEKAVSSLSVEEAINSKLDLQALSLILATRFAHYKQKFEHLNFQCIENSGSWKRLVAIQESIVDEELAKQGEHFAVLNVLPSMPLRDGEIQLPSCQEVRQAYLKKSKQYHMDKQYLPNRQQARISPSMRGWMMPKVTEAYEFLQSEASREGFGNRIKGLFLDKLKGLNGNLRCCLEKVLEEQKYSKLRTMLQDLRQVNRKLATKMRIPIHKLENCIQDHLIEEVRKTKEAVQSKWQGGLLRDLNEDLSKLKHISQELSAYPKIVPDNLIRDISKTVTDEILEEGRKAQVCISSCDSRQEAMACILQFGGHLIALGRICHHLRDFKLKAEEQISNALALCYEKGWGANFLLQLGMSLGKGKIGDPNTDDDTVAKHLLSSFSYLSDARTVMFNRETSVTQKDVKQTLREVSSWEVGANGQNKGRKIATRKLQEGWEEYDRLFDEHLKKWMASELTQDQLAQQVMATAAQLRTQSGGRWKPDVKAKIPELLAGIFALYAILRSGQVYSSMLSNTTDAEDKAEAVEPEDLLIKPHSIQILTLLSLTGYSSRRVDLESHVMQIRTGEGKSIALGGGAALLALLGFRVRCICYSKYLSQRDENAFSTLFAELKLQNNGSELIVYSTITEYSEDRTAQKGNVRDLTNELVATGKLKRKSGQVQGSSKAPKVSEAPQEAIMDGTSSAEGSSVTTPEDSASCPACREVQEILLVDEVDVFFGSDFYGQTHNQVAVLALPEVEALLRRIWKKKDDAANLPAFIQEVLKWKEFKALLQKLPDFVDMVQSEVSQMCADMKDHVETGNDYICNGSRIGYKVMDGIAYDVVKGYKTAFAYLQEASKGQLLDETILQKALALRIPCGRFSYANLGSAPKILGVSGTIEALGNYEWTVMQRFGIRSYTLVPSVYGRNNFAFLNQTHGMPITISTDEDHSFDIFTQVTKKVQEDRAVIVFFRDVKQTEAFMQSTYYNKIANKNALLPNLLDADKDWIAKKAATNRQVTVAPAIFGRGTDFCCFDDKLEQAGGVHIIQAFCSDDKSEEVQIQGRTSRQGKSGTYSLILAESEVRDLGLDPDSLQNMQAQACYDELCQAREQKRNDLVEEMEAKLEKTNAFDSQSHAYFDALLAGNSSLAKDQLNDLYKQLGRAGAAYHFVCCYDESGSMTGQPWQELVDAHVALMQTLQNQLSTQVSIVQFGSSSRTVLEFGDVTQAAQAKLVCKGGGTCFEPPLREALRLMRAGCQKCSSLTPVLLFMSDGCNGDGDCIQTIRSMEREFPSFVFHAVIFGEPDSERLREMVGAASNGHFHVSVDGVELV